jgi:DNA end-binding protein Ku
VAENLIEKKTAPFDASEFKNHYRAALRKLVDERLKGKSPKVETEEEERPRGDNVIDLMGALKRSLEGEGGKSARTGSRQSSSSSSRKSSSRKRPAKRAASKSKKRGGSSGKTRKSA